MRLITNILILAICFSAATLRGQEKITLDQCLKLAENNQFNFISENSQKKQTDLDLRFHKYSLFPSLTGSANFLSSAGRNLDKITNTFSSDVNNQHFYGLNASMPLFNGFSFWSQKNLFLIENEMNEFEKQRKLNSIHLTITELYFELCVLQLKVNLSTQRLTKLRDIHKIQGDLMIAGRINYIDTLRTSNSILNEEFLRKDDLSSFKSKTIDLNYYLGVTLDQNYVFDLESINSSQLLVLTDDELAKKQLEFEMKKVSVEQKQRKFALYPNLAINGSLGTAYSTYNVDYELPGKPVIPYRNQLEVNVNGTVGLQLNIPLFNRFEYLESIRLVEIKNQESAENFNNLDLIITKQKMQYVQSRVRLVEQCLNKKVIENNFKVIYEASMEEYKGGRITYNELQDSFMDWQSAMIDSESSNLELLKLDLLNKRRN